MKASFEERDTVELRMDARADNLALARLALAGVAARAGVPGEIVADLKLAVTEACANAIQHAYPDAASGAEVVVRYAVAEGRLAVEVADTGTGFDPQPRSVVAGEAEWGMGLLIVGEVTDELVIASSEAGSRVSFARRFLAEH